MPLPLRIEHPSPLLATVNPIESIVAESHPSAKIASTLSDFSGGIYVAWHVSAPDGHRVGRLSVRFLDSRCVPELALERCEISTHIEHVSLPLNAGISE